MTRTPPESSLRFYGRKSWKNCVSPLWKSLRVRSLLSPPIVREVFCRKMMTVIARQWQSEEEREKKQPLIKKSRALEDKKLFSLLANWLDEDWWGLLHGPNGKKVELKGIFHFWHHFRYTPKSWGEENFLFQSFFFCGCMVKCVPFLSQYLLAKDSVILWSFEDALRLILILYGAQIQIWATFLSRRIFYIPFIWVFHRWICSPHHLLNVFLPSCPFSSWAG